MNPFRIAITLLALGSTLCLSAQEARIHALKAGESLRQIAKTHLGGEEFATELQNLNDLPNPLAAKPGMLIILPGATRVAAFKQREMAEAAMQSALAADAKTYANPELQRTLKSISEIGKEIQRGNYEKARLLGLLAAAQAQKAKAAADERAVIEEPAKITAVQGIVQISSDAGKTWKQTQINDLLPVSDLLKTGADGRCEITLADESVLQLRPSSLFTIEAFRRDRRDDVRDSRLRVIMGDVFGKVKKRKKQKSRFKVNSSSTNVAIRGTALRVGGDADGKTRVALLTGDIQVEAESTSIEVAPNFGTVVAAGTPPSQPIELLPPPDMTRPATADASTGWVNNPFKWTPVRHKRLAGYRFTLATDPLFNSVINEQDTTKSHIDPIKLKLGTYHWRITSIDTKGLEGKGKTGILTVVRDLRIEMKPASQPVSKKNTWILGPKNTIQLLPYRNESTVETFEYSLNDQPFVESTDRIFFKNEGTFKLKARGIGENGEQGPLLERTILIDKTPPVVSIEVKPVGNKRRVTISATDKNGISSTRYRTQRTFQGYTDAILVDIGTSIDIRVVDRVGNTYSEKIFVK